MQMYCHWYILLGSQLLTFGFHLNFKQNTTYIYVKHNFINSYIPCYTNPLTNLELCNNCVTDPNLEAQLIKTKAVAKYMVVISL